jgi:hypothetical protein
LVCHHLSCVSLFDVICVCMSSCLACCKHHASLLNLHTQMILNWAGKPCDFVQPHRGFCWKRSNSKPFVQDNVDSDYRTVRNVKHVKCSRWW